jgi:hypothetical protein
VLVFEHPLAQRILAQRSYPLPTAYEALFIYADSPNDQIGSSSPIDIYATHLSAQPLIQPLRGAIRSEGAQIGFAQRSVMGR